MARFCGYIGYAHTETDENGVSREVYTRRMYYGDVLKNYRNLQNGESVNDNIVLNNQISVVADAYALQNYCAIRYAEWMGVKWKVNSVDVQHPRLILSFGGVFNGAEN